MFPSLFHSLIYNITLFSSSKKSRIVRKINREYHRLLSIYPADSIVLTYLNKKPFYCPFSHKLLFYQKDYPLYDKQLPKLCHWLQKNIDRKLSIIDVGANIGDTARNIGIRNAFYLCIEGDPKFSKYIKYNLSGYQYALENVYLCDNESIQTNFVIQSSNGTGHLIQNEGFGETVNTVTLDHLLKSKYGDIQFDLLKIDTDGFDFKVIRGAKQSLQKWHPLLFFEWDKAFCKEQGEDPLSIFPILDELGYKECILFDNFGNVFANVDTNNTALLKSYIDNTIGDGLPYYYDVLAIPPSHTLSIKQIYNLFVQ